MILKSNQLKEAEDQLRMSEERYRLLVEGVSDYAIFMLSPEGIIESWNEGAKKINGYSAKEIIGKHFSIFYTKEAKKEDYPAYELKEAKREGRFEDEGLRVRKDGGTYYAHVVITAIYNKENKLIWFSKITKDLTERKEVEDQLRKSEERYRLLIEGVKDYAIFMLSPEGIIQSWNEGAKKLKGYSASEIIGKHFSIFYPKDARESEFPQYELEQAKKKGRFEDEGIRIKKDGSTFIANVIITAIYGPDKKLRGFTKITRDLTERKEAEELLRKSEERHRLLIEGVKDYAIFMLSPEGYIESWNEGAKRLKGYTEREIIGKHFSKFYPKEAKDRGFPDFELEQARKLGRFEDEGIRVRKNGTEFFANVIITALYNKSNQLIGFSKITRDLSEKKEAEERLRKSEERYRLIIDAVKDYAIFMLSPEGYIESWNEGAKKLKGYTEKEIIGKHFSIFYPEETRDKLPTFELKQAKRAGRFENEDLRLKKDGSTFYANVVITPLYNSQNELVGFSKITRDLTERKLAEETLSNLNTELEQRVKERTEELSKTVNELKKINADLDNFIYTASHDLKAPVSNIEGLMNTLNETLKEYNFTNEDVESLMGMINKSVAKFQQTIRDLAAVNESQRGGKGEVVSIDLNEVIEDVTVSIDHLIKESKARITVETRDENIFRFSKVHIRSIVYNLLTNSIKYRSPKRPLSIHVKSYVKAGFYIIEVKDNGLGIKEENKEKIFQMFKRLYDHVEGSGIGLYILRRIVDNVGGKVEVISDLDKGATFKVYLPYASK